jgi:hypothetical protein
MRFDPLRRTGTARAGGGRRRLDGRGRGQGRRCLDGRGELGREWGRRRLAEHLLGRGRQREWSGGGASAGPERRRQARRGNSNPSLPLTGTGGRKMGRGAIGLGERRADSLVLSHSGRRESSGSRPGRAFAFHVYFLTALTTITSQFFAVCLVYSFWTLKAPKAEVEAQKNTA